MNSIKENKNTVNKSNKNFGDEVFFGYRWQIKTEKFLTPRMYNTVSASSEITYSVLRIT